MTSVTVRAEAGKLHVSSPYDATFISVVRCLGGKWSPESRTWSVPARQRDALRELLIRVYGADGGLPAPATKPGKAAAAPAAAPAPPAPPAPRPAPCRPPTLAELDAILDDVAPGWRRAEGAAA